MQAAASEGVPPTNWEASKVAPTRSGAQFRRFYKEFNRLQGLAREARFNGLDLSDCAGSDGDDE